MGGAERTVIECTNCGSGVWPLVIAAGAVAVAAAALWISAREHKEFMRQARARARFSLEMSVENYDVDSEGRIVKDASSIRPVILLSVHNEGDRAAGTTLLNALAPRFVEGFRWCGPKGDEVSFAGAAIPASEALSDGAGGNVEADYTAYEATRVTRKGAIVIWFCFTVQLTADEVVIPLAANAQADEIPDDVDEYDSTLVLRARRGVEDTSS